MSVAHTRFVVCRVIAIGAIDQVVFASFRQGMELARHAAADLAAISHNGTVVEATALADATVGVVHLIVDFCQGFLVGMEALCCPS